LQGACRESSSSATTAEKREVHASGLGRGACINFSDVENHTVSLILVFFWETFKYCSLLMYSIRIVFVG